MADTRFNKCINSLCGLHVEDYEWVVLDGSSVCPHCGVINPERASFDLRLDWSAPQTIEGSTGSSVAAPYLSPDSALTMRFKLGPHSHEALRYVNSSQLSRGLHSDKERLKIAMMLREASSRAHMPEQIVEMSVLIYADMISKRSIRGAARLGLIAKAVQMAFEKTHTTKTISDIAIMLRLPTHKLATSAKKSVEICFDLQRTQLDTLHVVSPADLIVGFCNKLGLQSSKLLNICQFAAVMWGKHGDPIAKQPESIASAILWMVLQEHCPKTYSRKAVAAACSVSEPTITSTVGKLEPHRSKFILPKT